jgi:hypothetical protein
MGSDCEVILSKDKNIEDLYKNVIHILGDEINCYNAMNRVINEWVISCEQNLSNITINRKSWLGWAACSIQSKIPEIITRKAWFLLSLEQQEMANKIADDIIKKWEERYLDNA